MRITNNLGAKMRKLGHTEPVPFVSILPLKLRSSISGKGGKMSDVCCIYEMSLMFSCFKQNEFAEGSCSKEVDNFKKCYKNHLETKKTKLAKEAKGLLTPGEKSLSPKQVNILLKMYPNLK